jgi:hypothetical protein
MLAAMLGEVTWSYLAFGVVFAFGVAAIVLRGEWSRARGLDKLLLFGPIFYAAPLAAFGTEHFTLTEIIASLVPSWIPGAVVWTYVIGACFIAAALSLVTRIAARLAASLLAVTFFLFVVLMDVPGYVQDPQNRIALTVALRELAFSGGALAMAARLGRATRIWPTVARIFVAVPVLFFAVEQFLHGDRVPAVPLEPLTPTYVVGRAIWTYLTAVVYAIGGALLLRGKRPRAAATAIGLSVLFVELIVYVPIGVVERASLGKGLNFVADTLMFCGAVLMLADAMPRE